MTTVGYGDLYPATEIGRIVVYFIAAFGTVMNALLMTVMIVKISLSDKQQKAVAFMSETRNHTQIEQLGYGGVWARCGV